MKFDEEVNINDNSKRITSELEDKSKYNFFNELASAVRTDEEYAKFKGYID